jgi:tetratricopeptide (TPR) repeat protein
VGRLEFENGHRDGFGHAYRFRSPSINCFTGSWRPSKGRLSLRAGPVLCSNTSMRAFLSHSSTDKEIVIAVHNGLEKGSTWIDRAEIEWGALFLEKIANGIASATDFVLFWSSAAAASEWVRIELNMAFIQALRRKAIRIRVVLLDGTPLPLYLQPFHVFSVIGSASPATEILEKLCQLLREPVRSARSPFVNRHSEIGRLEIAVDNPEFHAVWVFGFTGVGKATLVKQALNRIFEGADVVQIDATQGTGFVELALELRAITRNDVLPVGLDKTALESDIRLSIELLAHDGRMLLISNVQYWLEESGEPGGPLPLLLAITRDLVAFEKRPVFLTSTRRPSLTAADLLSLSLIHIDGLKDEHIATVVRNWHFSIYGRELSPEDALRIAPKLYGHPVAARLVAGLLGERTVTFLEQYPEEIISLRRDLARLLLQGLNLDPDAERLMETLALAGIPLPASLIVAVGFTDAGFQSAVKRCADAGLITADLAIETHPLFREFFWHQLHRGDYQDLSIKLAEAIKSDLDTLEKSSPEFAPLLLVAFRCYALAGRLGKANELRNDLSGELEATAIILYNRRNYALSDQYIQHVLDGDPLNWKMRLYRARIRIRQEEWAQADDILKKMLEERPSDIGVLHVMGWSQLRQHHLQEALEIFAGIIARREHVASLRDAAECMHRLGNNEEALRFLERAKQQESENPFALDLESRILEDLGQLEPAYQAALLAAARDPANVYMHNRLGIIRMKQGLPAKAIDHLLKAVELDHDLFSPANSLASAYLDTGDVQAAENIFPQLKAKARTPSNSALLKHTEARIAFSKREFETSRDILKREIALDRNMTPNLGLLVRSELGLFDENVRGFPAIAKVALKSAREAFEKIEEINPKNEFIPSLRIQIEEREAITAEPTPKTPSGSSAGSSGRTSSESGRPLPGLPKHVPPSHKPSLLTTTRSEKVPDSPQSDVSGVPGASETTAPQKRPTSKPPLRPPLKPPLSPPVKPPRQR